MSERFLSDEKTPGLLGLIVARDSKVGMSRVVVHQLKILNPRIGVAGQRVAC